MRRITARKAWIALLLALAPSVAHAEWRRATSKHFIVYSQASPNELKQSVVELERYDQLLRLLSISKPDEDSAPLTVFTVANAEMVGDLINQHDAAGVYIVGPLGPIAIVPRITSYGRQDDFTPEVVLFHEYAHHYMLQNYTAAYPGWFVEGYAELLGATTFDSDGSARVGNVATYRLMDRQVGTPIPISELLANDITKTRYDAFAFYSEAWLLTHYLVFNDTRSPQLHKYLALVSNGVKGPDAAKQAFGDVIKLAADYNSYRRSPALPGLHISQKTRPPSARSRSTRSAPRSRRCYGTGCSTCVISGRPRRRASPPTSPNAPRRRPRTPTRSISCGGSSLPMKTSPARIAPPMPCSRSSLTMRRPCSARV